MVEQRLVLEGGELPVQSLKGVVKKKTKEERERENAAKGAKVRRQQLEPRSFAAARLNDQRSSLCDRRGPSRARASTPIRPRSAR